ncbi:Alpha/beta hydrolase family protein [Anatilimnocola aggregata]|uniref:Alpha/beta hydrolase family protein n=1 Tax=Anatilimnocola aggregata TaxID=2528021 RepID=A0A517Y6Z2_9BACT|nr:alpha/beta fold hydrolase [Anatilimnocola aggregata]QDU25990.1 Alpha/beta hydrolase family protein [Anatilimnocola aggregata]
MSTATQRLSASLSWLPCAITVMAALCALGNSGCARQRYVTVREAPRNPLAAPLKLLARSGPKPTKRTEQLLRRYNLLDQVEDDPLIALVSFQKELAREPTGDKIYAYAELAYLEGKELELQNKPKEALDVHGAAVAHAYWYLFDPGLDHFRNPYDPQFRRACDLYNGALESALRIVSKNRQLKPGTKHVIKTGKKEYHLEIEIRGPWRQEDLSALEFVSTYEISSGLTNHHHSYGLGVPLIAVRTRHTGETPAEKYYPPGLSFAVTAFMRVEENHDANRDANVHRCVLELYDPLLANSIKVCNHDVPLESDISTPLAFFLDDPQFQETDTSTLGLLNPGTAKGIKGLFMVEPYDPQRIPVVMVHGLWSSPTTWMEMFNDLRAFPEIRKRYQFWFFQYPTGQPFWTSAAQMRDALAQMRADLDPHGANPNLDQMILVGHSMGGLVSRMQTIESGDRFWNLLGNVPIEQIKASDDERSKLAKCFYFHPNPSVKRVITLGTPHHGSNFADDYTRYFGRTFITLPEMMVELSNKLIRDNPDSFRNTDLLTRTTSIDSLAPDCQIFAALNGAERGPHTSYHNVIGVVPSNTFIGRFSEEGDGVVGKSSATLQEVASEKVVPADHMSVHRYPLSILEVRRILLEHVQAQPEHQPEYNLPGVKPWIPAADQAGTIPSAALPTGPAPR